MAKVRLSRPSHAAAEANCGPAGLKDRTGAAAGHVAIVGGTVVDLIFGCVPRLPRWPHHRESTSRNLVCLETPPILTLGGNGANAAYVAARCGAQVVLHTAVGDDALGRLAREWLQAAGCRIDDTAAPRPPAATAVNMIAANARHERAMLFYPGAVPQLDSLGATAPAPAVVLVAGWPHPPLPVLAETFRQLRSRGSFTVLDAGPILGAPWTLRRLEIVLAQLDLYLTNDYELARISGARLLDPAVRRLRQHYAGHAVIKCGAKGVLWLPRDSDVPEPVPARPVPVVNTVGAGDAFNGALLAALARGAAFPAALRLGCRVAASVVRSPRGVLGMVPAAFN